MSQTTKFASGELAFWVVYAAFNRAIVYKVQVHMVTSRLHGDEPFSAHPMPCIRVLTHLTRDAQMEWSTDCFASGGGGGRPCFDEVGLLDGDGVEREMRGQPCRLARASKSLRATVYSMLSNGSLGAYTFGTVCSITAAMRE